MVDGASPKSAVMVAPWLHDAGIVREVYGGEDKVQERLAQARAARGKYAKTGQIDYVKAASNSDPSAAMYWPGEALDYYLNPERGKVPEWGGRLASMAWEEWLTFDPISIASGVRAPVRLVTGEGSATPGGARKFESALGGPHDSVWIEGNQFEFYDDPGRVIGRFPRRAGRGCRRDPRRRRRVHPRVARWAR
jgi:hypothetical protein